MMPFDSYPDQGRKLLGPVRGSNARHDYGQALMRLSGQTRCAYCDTDLTATYEIWLTIVVDHVIPVSVCKSLGLPEDWCWDFLNMVLACSACNGFCNRYKPQFPFEPPKTLEGFCNLRDAIFAERKEQIASRHQEERRFFARR